MSFIENISKSCAKWLATKVPNDKYPTVEDQIEVFTYGFMVIVGALAKGTIMVSLALILEVFIPAMVIMFTFSSLRIIAGGYHFAEYNKCVTFSTLQFIGSALTAQYTLQYWSLISTWFLSIFCILLAIYNIKKHIPRDTPNKQITKELEIKKFKRWSLYYLIAWASIMIIFLLFNVKLIVLSSCLGLLLELFSVSKVGYGIYAKLESWQ